MEVEGPWPPFTANEIPFGIHSTSVCTARHSCTVRNSSHRVSALVIGVAMQTSNNCLQEQLASWHAQLALLPVPPPSDAVEIFVRGFVPLKDIEEEDILHFANNLVNDTEFFESIRREIGCCSTGELVEKVAGDQRTKAVFTIRPPQGTLNEESSLDIVREVCFISSDGVVWRAEG